MTSSWEDWLDVQRCSGTWFSMLARKAEETYLHRFGGTLRSPCRQALYRAGWFVADF